MSDTLSASNALSRNSLLEQIAHPTLVNPLAAQTSAATAAEQVWRVRQQQANQAAGEAYQGAIDAQGNFSPAKFNQNLVEKGPSAALAAQSGVESAQKLRGSQIEQSAALRDQIGKEVSGLLDVPDDQLGAGINAAASRLKARGVPENVIHQYLLDMPTDPAGRRATLEQLRRSLMPSDQLQTTLYGTTGTETGQDGRRIGTVQQPAAKGGAVTAVPDQGVPLGVSADTRAGVMTIHGPSGDVTDTYDGLVRKGVLTQAGQPAPGYSFPAATPAMVEALRGQEATPDGRTSVAGARGQMQVTPGFFRQYAHPGESFDSKRDVEEVAQRGIAALEKKYPNDPARVAVAYFSGEDNVAPPGSPTPYKVDKKDANGTSTSSYVAGVTSRYKPGQTAAATPPAPGPGGVQPGGGVVTPAGSLEQNKIDQEQYNQRTVEYNNNDANLIANLKEAYVLGRQIATGKGLQGASDVRSGLVSLGRAFGIEMGKLDTDDQIRAELDKVLNQVLASAPGAKRSDASLSTTAGGTPHLGMNTNAMLNQIRIMYGQVKQQNAAMLAHDPNKKGIGFQSEHRDMMSGTSREGFAADIMTHDEIMDKVKRLGGKDAPAAKAFMRGVNRNGDVYRLEPGSGLGE